MLAGAAGGKVEREFVPSNDDGYADRMAPITPDVARQLHDLPGVREVVPLSF